MISRECKNGHESLRNKWGKCIQCTRDAATRWRLAHPEQNAQAKDDFRRRNAEDVNASQRAWRAANPGKASTYSTKWNKAHPEAMAAVLAKRRARKLNATPAWADDQKIKAVYAEAAAMRLLGLDVHVDHVIPLQGKLVSGLHVHNNLRVLLASDNRTKGNRPPA